MKQNKKIIYTTAEDIVTHVLKHYEYSSYVIQKTIEDINKREDLHKIMIKDTKPIVPNKGKTIDKVIDYLISLKEKGYTDVVDTSERYDPYPYFEVQCDRLENDEEYYIRISNLTYRYAEQHQKEEQEKFKLEQEINELKNKINGKTAELEKLKIKLTN